MRLKVRCLLMLVGAAGGLTQIDAAQAHEQVEFAKMTSPEVAAALKGGASTIIIPIGGTEQSGPFIAVGKHNVRAYVLACRIAHGVGHTLVAPVIAYVPEGGTTPRTSHMRFAGTISIPLKAFEALLIGAAESFRVQGFQKVAFIGDHGGYRDAVANVVKNLNARWGARATALDVSDYYASIHRDFAPWLKKQGLGAAVGMHADVMDTSLMLAVDPTMVRIKLMARSPKPGAAEGVYGGDPRASTASLGQRGLQMQVDAAMSQLRKEMK